MSYLNHPNVRELLDEVADEESTPSTTDRTIQEKILHVLNLYPKISPAMLQVGIGTSLPPDIWRPNYQKLIELGLIKEYQENHVSPSGRNTRHTFIMLTYKLHKGNLDSSAQ